MNASKKVQNQNFFVRIGYVEMPTALRIREISFGIVWSEEAGIFVGVSVSIRDKDDHFQVWNENWEGAVKSGVVEKITKQLLPKIKFHSTFYKEHKNHHKFEKNVSNKMLNFSSTLDKFRFDFSNFQNYFCS